MCEENQTWVTEFLLLGFQDLYGLKILFFSILLLLYIATVTTNLLIIVLVTLSQRLHSPMYFFLGNLSVSDIILTTDVVPNSLLIILNDGIKISIAGCFTQLFMYGASGTAECFLLAVMSYDRYLAICSPLRYASVMDSKLQLHLITYSWLLGFVSPILAVSLLSQLHFCGLHTIDHFFCDLAPILDLASSDTTMVLIEQAVASLLTIFFPFVFIIITYVCIAVTIVRIPSNIGRRKAFSTCSSHLAIVCIYYGSLMTIYLFPNVQEMLKISKVQSLLYTVLTPLFNPVIYSLRNMEMKTALKNIFIKREKLI